MKIKITKIKYLLLILFMTMGIFSCQEDFLDRQPLDAIGENSFFTSHNDLKNYMNGLYDGLVRRVSDNRWRILEDGTDNLVSNNPHSSLMQHSASGEAPSTSGLWNGSYDFIREVNYILENAPKVPETPQSKHYVGEAYYARAWKYYELLKAYGGVPYIDKVLNIDSEELFTARASRNFIATKIIEDLDKAIDGLDWKGEGEAGAQRINKQAALVLKTRVGLFEGTWEYYHGQKSTPFATSGKDGSEFLQYAVDAGEMLIAHEGGNIFKGPVGWEYFNLFNQMDCSNVPGAYLFFAYSRSDEFNIINQYFGKLSAGSEVSLTKGAIDAYLMNDGKPSEISGLSLDELSQASYGVNKDPRLRQTIFTPDRGIQTQFFNGVGLNIQPIRFTAIRNQTAERSAGPGGIRIWKGQSFDVAEERNGGTDDIVLRYAEGILNYAEAKAVLGTISQADLDKSVNVLRDRVGMPGMNLAEINGWSVSYDAENGYDPTATNIVNEIRRERRVELMLEGFRKDDLRRWALLGEVFNGRMFWGAPAQELVDYWNDTDGLIADGWDAAEAASFQMTLGSEYGVDPSGDFINPYFLDADFKQGGRGYLIDEGRDYLSGIPKNEISTYEENGVTLEQNPGWF